MDLLRSAVADISTTITGPSASPPPQRTIISHAEFADAEDEFPESSLIGNDSTAKPTTNGTTDAIINKADQLFERAASATPGGAKPKSRTTTPKPSTKKTAAPKSPKSTTKTAKPAKPAASTTKTAPKPKETKPAKPTNTTSKAKATWDNETGPDTSVQVDGEQQWEIADIVGQEGDILLVKWKGWKGVWEEDHAVIAESAPELVKAFEAKVEELGRQKAAGGKKRGRPAGVKATSQVGSGAGSGVMTARKAASKAAGGKGRAKKIALKEETQAKVTKKAGARVGRPKKAAAAASPKKAAASPKKAAAPPEKPAPSPKKTTASPKKAAPSTKKAAPSPKKTATKTRTTVKAKAPAKGARPTGVAKRGRPAKK